MKALSQLQSLSQDKEGASAAEFAVVLPLLLLMIMGFMNVGQQFYARSLLEGAIQEAARRSSLESATDAGVSTLIDESVIQAVKPIVGSKALFQFNRQAFYNYRIAETKAEEFSDSNDNGVCDNNEPYEDLDGNSAFSKSITEAGQGGAKDVQIYTVNLEFQRMFPMLEKVGFNDKIKIQAQTLLKNQPYAGQAKPKIGNCT
jgi:Flp pilus assembly protein TadG